MKLSDRLHQYQEQPDAALWQRIELNLKPETSTNKKFGLARVPMVFKIEAVFLFIAVVLIGISVNFKTYDNQLFVSNHSGSMKMEELTTDSEPYYEIQNIENLKKAYAMLQ